MLPARHSLGLVCGEIAEVRRAAGLILTEIRYRPGAAMPRHWHQYAHLYTVLGGACTDYHRATTVCSPSTVIFHPPRETHASRCHEAGARIFGIELEPVWMDRVCRSGGVLDRSIVLPRTAAGLVRRLHHEFTMEDGAASLAMEGLVLEILAEAARQRDHPAPRSSRSPAWLHQAQDLLHDQFTENLSLTGIAEAVGVHPTHLARAFRKQLGCTLGEYVRRLRIDLARRSLRETDAPLGDIAAAAGFYDQSHFTKTFKRHLGITPLEYRKRFGGAR